MGGRALVCLLGILSLPTIHASNSTQTAPIINSVPPILNTASQPDNHTIGDGTALDVPMLPEATATATPLSIPSAEKDAAAAFNQTTTQPQPTLQPQHTTQPNKPASTPPSKDILQQARAGLTTALREVKKCRQNHAQCQEDLTQCQHNKSPASATSSSSENSSDSAGKLREAQASLEKYRHEYAELRSRAETLSKTAQQQLQQLKKEQLEAKSQEEQCRRQLLEAAAAESAHAKLQAQSRQMATQLSVLRRKLEQKEQIENAIEGKHNKLTEVYKSLESECQVELQRCKSHLAGGGGEHGVHEEAVPPPPEQQQQQQRARVLEALPQPCSATANGGGSSSSGLLFGEEHQLRLLLGVFAAGVLVGWAVRLPGKARNGASHSLPIRGTRVEEVNGWMPYTDSMKLS